MSFSMDENRLVAISIPLLSGIKFDFSKSNRRD